MNTYRLGTCVGPLGRSNGRNSVTLHVLHKENARIRVALQKRLAASDSRTTSEILHGVYLVNLGTPGRFRFEVRGVH